ncbi:MAG TPA: endonuclease/exonuclease/phosphatase [Alphaproteobacteria bacterium]|nr:endonuclease/exonuclease/phosphatase [Alphaproteobacteria bacterium]
MAKRRAPDFEPVTAISMQQKIETITVASWNIHAGIGSDGKFNADRIAAVINTIDPDIIAIQEVESRTGFGASVDLFTFLARCLPGHLVDAKSITTRDGHYGQMLLSKFPLSHREVHDISYPDREPRKIIDAHAQTPFGAWRVLATHLGLSAQERKFQLARLSQLIAQPAAMPTVLIGDFNLWRNNRQLRRLDNLLPGGVTRHRTFPARLPLFALDRIWCGTGIEIRKSESVTTARSASDHLPIVADLCPAR